MADRKKPYKRPPRPKKKGGTEGSDSGEESASPKPADNEGSRPKKKPKLTKGPSDQSALFELVTTSETSEVAGQAAGEDEVMGEDGEEKDDDGELSEDGSTRTKCENFDNCKRYLGNGKRLNRPGPNGRLCSRCGDRYQVAKKKAKGGPVSEPWRVSRQRPKANGGKKPKVEQGGGENADEERDDGEKCENFDYCKKYLGGGRTKSGPNGELCNACGQRYDRAKASAKDKPVGEAWRVPAPGRRLKGDDEEQGGGDKCENFDNCKRYLVRGHTRLGPNGDLCESCGKRYLNAKSEAKGGPVGEEWREAGQLRDHDQGVCNVCGGKCVHCARVLKFWKTKACKDCDRTLPEDDSEDRCEPCSQREQAGAPRRPTLPSIVSQIRSTGTTLSFTKLREIAFREWRTINQNNPSVLDRRFPVGRNYWSTDDYNSLSAELVRCGLPVNKRREAARLEMTNILQTDDAWNGYLPRHQSIATQLERLSSDELLSLARAAGYFRIVKGASDIADKSLQNPTETAKAADSAANGAQEDEEGDEEEGEDEVEGEQGTQAGAEGASSTAAKKKKKPKKKKISHKSEDLIDFLRSKRDIDDEVLEIDPESVDFVRDAVTAVRSRLLRAQARRNNVSYETFNHGVSSEWKAALGRLQITLNNGLSPAWTPGHRLFCGVNALAMSIHAIRRFYYGRTNPAVHSNPVTPLMLRALLFQNCEDAGRQGILGIPTPEYEAYLRDEWDRTAQNAHARSDSYDEMTSLDNFSILQLRAMVVLAHRAGLIEAGFSLGYVQGSATVDDAGNVAPATAQIVHEADTATVWLHHNLAASDGYDHWEGFEENTANTDTEIVFEWGLSTPLSRDAPRPRFDPNSAEDEDLIPKLHREMKNAQQRYLNHVRSKRSACIQCQDAGTYLTCKYTGGRRFCDPCEERGQWEKCRRPKGSAPDLFSDAVLGPASEYTAERRLDWLRLQNVADEEEDVLRTLNHLLDPDIEGPNFFVFGHARHSSHPGAPTVQQTMQNLLATLNSYSNFLNIPANQNTVEGTRPGGIGTAMQTHRTVVVRHGTRPIPTHTGNVVDPMLHAFLAMVDHLFRANNAHPPIEIHFMLLGIAGFSVGIEGFGDRTQGFFRNILLRDQANNTNYADRIYLVFVMELGVVDQNAFASINHGLPPHGMTYQTKQIVKVPLGDMIDRYTILKNHALTIGYSMRAYMQQITFLHRGMVSIFNLANPLPLFPQNQARVNEIDRMIMGMTWEHDWRSAWLDGTTMPTDAMVAANNTNRNAPM